MSTRGRAPQGSTAFFLRNFSIGFLAVVVVAVVALLIGASWPVAVLLGLVAGVAAAVVQRRRFPDARRPPAA